MTPAGGYGEHLCLQLNGSMTCCSEHLSFPSHVSRAAVLEEPLSSSGLLLLLVSPRRLVRFSGPCSFEARQIPLFSCLVHVLLTIQGEAEVLVSRNELLVSCAVALEAAPAEGAELPPSWLPSEQTVISRFESILKIAENYSEVLAKSQRDSGAVFLEAELFEKDA